MAQHEGFHGHEVNRAKGDLDCARCHTEHLGENFRIYKWPTSKDDFDHRTTGYPLVGRHAGLTCEQCHNSRHIPEADRKRIMNRDLNRTFEGLHPACLNCHEDRHAGQLGADCQKCHDFAHWKPVRSFDHSSTHFPLTGRHENVECAKCHKPEAANAKVIQYTGLEFAQCSGCHQDPHHGAFAARCESCHNTDSWKQVHLTSGFDHSKTKFPLAGKHEGLACLKCHKDSNFKTPVAHAKCMDCHQDQHKGQFVSRTDHGECASCHVVEGWKPTTFTEVSHRSTSYPLAGKHTGVACAKCHTPAGLDTNYHPASKACLDCHRDPHAAQFAAAPRLNRCEDCHTVAGFHPSTFTLTQHQTSRFALKGAHSAVACQECHRKEAGPPGADRQFHFGSTACEACHQDPHHGEFPEVLKASAKPGQDICESCHVVRTWQQLKNFDHGTTTFALAGAHAPLHCGDCHKSNAPEAAVREIPFKTAPERCEGCHEDIHGGQFRKGTDPVDCASCHSATHWTATQFNHDTASTFSLSGAHEDVPCRLCHTERHEIAGRTVVMYRGTPRECSACHR